MTLHDLATAMRDRRHEIGLRQDDVAAAAGYGISRPQWSKFENGHDGNFRPSTFAAIDRALQWKTGTARSYYETGVAAPTTPAATDAAPDVQDQLAVLRAELASVREQLRAQDELIASLIAELAQQAQRPRPRRRPAER